jgi:hypothetical protein
MKTIPALLSLILLVGCANGYRDYYKPNANFNPKGPTVIPTTEPLKIYTTDNFKRDVDGLVAKSYFPIGESAFNGASNKVSESQLRKEATDLGAAVVLTSSHYTHTVSGAVPLVLPHTTTAYTTGSATAYGPGGSATAYGNSTTTTYGTETTMMPYQIRRSDFDAVYFVKVKQRVGAVVVPLDDAGRKRIGTNSGMLVRIVVEGSPAFLADVFAGDILMAVNDEKVYSQESYKTILDTHEGQNAVFHFNRDGQMVDKTLHINSYK